MSKSNTAENLYPQPMTAEEILALPQGPAYGVERHEVTEIDRARGYMIVSGKRVPPPRVKYLDVPSAPKTVAVYFDETDIMSCCDSDGVMWALGKYEHGEWFRRRVYI